MVCWKDEILDREMLIIRDTFVPLEAKLKLPHKGDRPTDIVTLGDDIRQQTWRLRSPREKHLFTRHSLSRISEAMFDLRGASLFCGLENLFLLVFIRGGAMYLLDVNMFEMFQQLQNKRNRG